MSAAALCGYFSLGERSALLGLWFPAVLWTLPILDGHTRRSLGDTQSLLFPRFHRSEIFGLLAGFGTTFAALPDLIAMLRRRSATGMNPRMAAIMGVFQVLWVYYGLLILSRPVIIWNLVAIFINSLSVGAYFHFAKKERQPTQ